MYGTLKKILKRVIPKKILFKHERFFRFAYYLFYIGNKYKCNVCNRKIRAFKLLGTEKLCPSCGSLPRTRRLWQLISQKYLKDNLSILDFSPSRNLYLELKKKNLTYIASDLSGNFIADVAYDLTKVACKNNTYDLIICYHILEHIMEDEIAMFELNRILKTNGHCIIQTPFKEGDIYENNTIISNKDRTEHFGQEDHVRIYSISGLKSRLEKADFIVNVLNYNEDETNYFGFSANETILVCSKQK